MPATMRAIVGAVALYGFLLQAFVAAASPTVALGAGHVLCAPGAGAKLPGGGTPGRHDHPCCTVAHSGALALPPVTGGMCVALARVSAASGRAPLDADLARRPAYAFSARGPPPV